MVAESPRIWIQLGAKVHLQKRQIGTTTISFPGVIAIKMQVVCRRM